MRFAGGDLRCMAVDLRAGQWVFMDFRHRRTCDLFLDRRVTLCVDRDDEQTNEGRPCTPAEF